ncbi:hypothetical protein GWK47_026772 [Chionoecetes opilio]|uniref:Uncharacterized protein n=1 Tax=Chionoecetes opilio TaxID=41210 RepID=A0A8J8WMS9_CHIOP|nr:hypothetical protein GWK47_026772 [Chionoecetes opilio]
MEDPQDFANKLKCKYAILEAKSKHPGEIPRRDKIIMKKLLRGLPSHSKEKLELFMDEQIPLKKFIERVETERAIAIGRDTNRMFAVNQPRQPSEITPTSQSSPPNTQEQSRNCRLVSQRTNEVYYLGSQGRRLFADQGAVNSAHKFVNSTHKLAEGATTTYHSQPCEDKLNGGLAVSRQPRHQKHYKWPGRGCKTSQAP